MTRPEPDEEGVVWTCHVPCETPQAARARQTTSPTFFIILAVLTPLPLVLAELLSPEHLFGLIEYSRLHTEPFHEMLDLISKTGSIALLTSLILITIHHFFYFKTDLTGTSPTGWIELTCHLTSNHFTAINTAHEVRLESSWDKAWHYQKTNFQFFDRGAEQNAFLLCTTLTPPEPSSEAPRDVVACPVDQANEERVIAYLNSVGVDRNAAFEKEHPDWRVQATVWRSPFNFTPDTYKSIEKTHSATTILTCVTVGFIGYASTPGIFIAVSAIGGVLVHYCRALFAATLVAPGTPKDYRKLHQHLTSGSSLLPAYIMGLIITYGLTYR